MDLGYQGDLTQVQGLESGFWVVMEFPRLPWLGVVSGGRVAAICGIFN